MVAEDTRVDLAVTYGSWMVMVKPERCLSLEKSDGNILLANF